MTGMASPCSRPRPVFARKYCENAKLVKRPRQNGDGASDKSSRSSVMGVGRAADAPARSTRRRLDIPRRLPLLAGQSATCVATSACNGGRPMSYQPSRWATGLVPLAMLWVLGSTGAIQDVERTHSQEVARALADDVDSPEGEGARPRYRAPRRSVHPCQPDAGRRRRAWERLRRALGQVRRGSASSPPIGPYAWWIVRNGDTVTHLGQCAEPEGRTAIAAAAKPLGTRLQRPARPTGAAPPTRSPPSRTIAAQAARQFQPRRRRFHRWRA